MKIITIILVGILLISTQVFADLSVSDLEKIESIVKDSEARMKEYVTGEIEKVNNMYPGKSITRSLKWINVLTIQIGAVDTQVGRNFNLVLGLIALIAVAVGLPQIITAWQGRKLQEQTEKYDALKQEIEMLKQERIVRP